MNVVASGADGFIGWRLRVRASTNDIHKALPLYRSKWIRVREFVCSADMAALISGVNRLIFWTNDVHAPAAPDTYREPVPTTKATA